MDWDDLRVVLAIGQAGSLSGAARSLGQNHSTVFRRINAIEKKFGVRFFDRLPQGYVMTDAGEMAVVAAERINGEVNDLSRELIGKDLRLQGSIRVTAPEGISLKILQPAINEFCKQHPEIQIDLVVTGNALQLSRREADLAIRVTNKPPDTSIGKRVSQFRFGLYASKAYLNKCDFERPQTFDWLLMDDSRNWFTQSHWKILRHPAANTVVSSDSITIIMMAAKAGLGIAPLPCFLGDDEQDLVRINTGISNETNLPLELWLLMHSDLRNTARVRALMTFLYEHLKKSSDLFAGEKVTEHSTIAF